MESSIQQIQSVTLHFCEYCRCRSIFNFIHPPSMFITKKKKKKCKNQIMNKQPHKGIAFYDNFLSHFTIWRFCGQNKSTCIYWICFKFDFSTIVTRYYRFVMMRSQLMLSSTIRYLLESQFQNSAKTNHKIRMVMGIVLFESI